ncbi:hypothetical protein SCP_0906390 [Sparassis crispa]|uniref:Uncharacterized protein n=1 Tax=Sparassis crispa TaxID=139825 RepID=A0A401GWZ8_9APHY|nr:hypothetical protein SCP_0906390 [Sparassis crispa]GBE86758.1 hypothetical protein SCP_0906390 [Sparassis crispa]
MTAVEDAVEEVERWKEIEWERQRTVLLSHGANSTAQNDGVVQTRPIDRESRDIVEEIPQDIRTVLQSLNVTPVTKSFVLLSRVLPLLSPQWPQSTSTMHSSIDTP